MAPRKTIQQRITELRKVSGGSSNVGWMHDEVCWLLFGLIRFYRPSLVIQTGHLWGKSALVALEALRNEFLDPDRTMGDPQYAEFVERHSPMRVKGRLLSIDPQPNEASVKWLKERYPNFAFYAGSSQQYFQNGQKHPIKGRLFGIVDGDHTEQGAFSDLKSLAKLGAGMILLDDTSWIPQLKAAGHGIGYSVMELPEYNGVMVLTRP
jgi:cephalosporin hydroxylase